MSRYIDKDEVLEIVSDMTECDDDYVRITEWVRTMPSIDIVRCKECRHWTGETEHYEDKEYKACWQLCGQYVNSEFWCKYGEREGE